MSTDFRALCAELLGALENEGHAHWPGGPDGDPLIEQARAALAAEADGPAVQSREPASVVGEPSDEQAQQLFDSLRTPIYGRLTTDTQDRVVGHEPVRPGDFARAVLARYGHQPAPPDEGEVADEARYLTKELRDQADDLSPSLELFGLMHRAADLLEQRHPAPVPVDELLAAYRSGAADAAHPTPVPVSERPWEREGWCDDEDRCWCMSSLDGPPPRWWLVRPEPLSDGWVLPATALPLPQGEVQP